MILGHNPPQVIDAAKAPWIEDLFAGKSGEVS